MLVTIPQVEKIVAWEEAVKIDMSVAAMKLQKAKVRGKNFRAKVAPLQNSCQANDHVLSSVEPIAWSVGVQTVVEQTNNDALPMAKEKIPGPLPLPPVRSDEVGISVGDLEHGNQQAAVEASGQPQIYYPKELTVIYCIVILMIVSGVAVQFFTVGDIHKFVRDLLTIFFLLGMQPLAVLKNDEIMEWLDERFSATTSSNDGNEESDIQ